MLKKILTGWDDISRAWKRRSLALMLGWQDIKQRYRRSKLGPFWLTISMAVMITMIGLIFGQALKRPMDVYLPFVASGIIFWNFISSSINDGAKSFISSAGMIRQLGLPLALYPMRVLWRNIVVLGHNIVIIPIVLLLVGKPINLNILWLIPGFLVVIANLFWFSLLMGVFCTRFRDMPPIIASLVQVLFYVTPIIWMPDSVGARVSSFIVNTNPAYHVLELVRAPILGYAPSPMNWTISVGVAVLGLFVSMVFYGTYKKRIAYWI